MGDLLVIVPSRNRPQNIARLLDAVHDTAKMKTHVRVCVDTDDPELERYEYVMSKAARDGDHMNTGPRMGLTAWTNEVALRECGDYPYLASLGDDMIPETQGWDRALIRGIQRMGNTGFTYPWDGIREDIPEAVCMSSDIVEALGWMALPDLDHWYIDNVWADLGRGAGCIRHLRAISVRHAWKADKTSKDSGEKLIADRDKYYSWRKTRMADDIKAVLAARGAVSV
jgi:hypothetical protein